MSEGQRETVLHFGEAQRLFGILTLPAHIDPRRPVVVIPNTGFEHRIGPNRLHVQIARALAAAGFCVLRFDVSGLGDSDAERGQAASALVDCQRALDALDQRRLGERYVVIGLCSGSHDGHQLCRVDERVTGLFNIDGYAYRNPRHWAIYWLNRVSHPLRSLRNVAGRWLPRYRIAEPQGMAADLTPWPEQAEVAADYASFLRRGVRLGFVFTGDLHGSYLYADQHYDVFPMLRGRAQVTYRSHIDHTLTRRAAREEMIAHIRQWLQGLTP